MSYEQRGTYYGIINLIIHLIMSYDFKSFHGILLQKESCIPPSNKFTQISSYQKKKCNTEFSRRNENILQLDMAANTSCLQSMLAYVLYNNMRVWRHMFGGQTCYHNYRRVPFSRLLFHTKSNYIMLHTERNNEESIE